MTFDPNAHMRNLKGQQYLEVKWRLVWFREDHPDWAIHTGIVEHNAEAGLAVFRADVTGDGITHATGHKMETRKGFEDYLEKAETGAIGRALAVLGYGTQFAQELDEGDRIVDSPVPPRRVQGMDATPKPPMVQMIDVDDRLYKHYLGLCQEAHALGVEYETVTPPVPRQLLVDVGKELSAAVGLAKAKAPVK